MTLVPVELGERSYQVRIESGLLGRAHEHLAPFARGGRLIVVSDEHVWAAQGARLSQGLGGIEAAPIIVPPGEGSKSWSALADLVDRLLALGIERKDHIVAFGGGVIGDLVGFAAAIVKRGCAFIQVPTSLLAQVDSSVGGKTAINVAAGKNLAGLFHQPALVLIDPDCLASLDERELRAGYAEIVKYALIEDRDFFAWLERHYEALLAGEPATRDHAIAASVRGKARIVAQDERETSGRRALLNFGHSFGHALEAETGFSGRLLHGEAVAVGMVLAFELSVEHGLCPLGDALRARAHLAGAGLPVGMSDAGIDASGERLVGHMLHDKKMEGGRLPLILTRGIGQAFIDGNVALEMVAAFLDRQS